jgi:hypothetical protein
LREQKNADFHKSPKKNKQYTLMSMMNQQLVKHFTNPTFLSGKIVYGDSTMCVIKHQSEIGKGGKTLISLAYRDAKVKQYELRLFKDLQEVDELKAYRKGNKLAIVSNHRKRMGVAFIDLNEEKIIWEYLPTQD